MNSDNKTVRRLIVSIAAILILSCCLGITTYALVIQTVSVDDNLFQTGQVKINLNDGKPVIEAHEFLFEPGMTVKKDFFIENQSTWDVYYKIYFDNVGGGLSTVLEITIRDSDMVLFNGTPAELTRANADAAGDLLRVGQRHDLTMEFHFPEEVGNSAQNLTLSFDMCADAVQTKNNPDKLFE